VRDAYAAPGRQAIDRHLRELYRPHHRHRAVSTATMPACHHDHHLQLVPDLVVRCGMHDEHGTRTAIYMPRFNAAVGEYAGIQEATRGYL
jgi:hypothetical protein